ncbi:hypothetical protein Mame01_08420 [Microbispora amethystogenes]|nr:hypothetical protein Mame01_08420 [Microbispora amethystogenes]
MRGKSTGARATEEEMYWIARAVANGRQEWSSIKFYDANGRNLNLPEPDWSTFGRLPDFYF